MTEKKEPVEAWKLWDGYGPIPGKASNGRENMMGIARIGPEGEGGLSGAEGRDILGLRADLLLAAAAPDLLQACMGLLPICRIETDIQKSKVQRAKAAIAKALEKNP